ncbi:MAG: hypothetical protein V4601_12180 [Pseudomonadota bacterium]
MTRSPALAPLLNSSVPPLVLTVWAAPELLTMPGPKAAAVTSSVWPERLKV